jgi:3-oxoadipate enol-lactonase
MPYVRVAPNLRIHYETHGLSGPWVVLVMGLGASSRLWGDLPERLTAGEPPYRVLTLDNRGTGKSDPPTRPFRMRDMADDLARVMEHADIARAHIVGVSMGGMIAQHFAIHHPSRVEGLALLSTTPGVLHSGPPHPRALRSLLSYGSRGMDGETMVADLLLARSQKHLAREVLKELKVLVGREATRPTSFFAQLLACAFHDTGASLARITAPTVIVTGDEDIVLPPRGSRVLAKLIPNARYEELTATGHGVPFTDREIIQRMLAMLRRAHTTADTREALPR